MFQAKIVLIAKALQMAVHAPASSAGLWDEVWFPLITFVGGAAVTAVIAWIRNRSERLRGDRMIRRSNAYGDIWRLTGAFNLFGPHKAVDPERLTDDLREWYFTHGQMLTEAARTHYFLIQEALMFCHVNRLRPTRPERETLYGNFVPDDAPVPVRRLTYRDIADPQFLKQERTSSKLNEMLADAFKPDHLSGGYVPRSSLVRCDTGGQPFGWGYDLSYLSRIVNYWKATVRDGARFDPEVRAWLLLQHLLSRFRTRLTDELESRGPGI